MPNNYRSMPGNLTNIQHCLTVRNLTQLGELKKLTTLILDCNGFSSHTKFPYMPSLTTLWINKNLVTNLTIFIEEVAKKFPNLRILSMMDNEAAPSYFNGGSYKQYLDYRHYVISQMSTLEVLDDKQVLDEECKEAGRVYKLQRSTVKKRKM
nr:PREDICTED: uncharacterized protein LOC102347411 isoform X2 [Latimeria chalumnae]|eukprot:XP_014353772.1 PREDICTED: uncharacterized protein LOC102347411 isoform X2 [Latimeria chalumnae]